VHQKAIGAGDPSQLEIDFENEDKIANLESIVKHMLPKKIRIDLEAMELKLQTAWQSQLD